MNKTEHLLVILMEECSEVQKNASKALRFGLYDHAPDTTDTNADKIVNEIADLFGVLEMLNEERILSIPYESTKIEEKKKKVKRYLEYSKLQGTLTEK